MMKKFIKRLNVFLVVGFLIIGLIIPSVTARAADTEGITQFVTRLYQVCFGRKPDDAGLRDWSNRLATGQETGAQVTYGFVFSDEFRNMNLCNSHYVDALYEAFFGRTADDAGKADWMNRLASGQTRGAVMTGFVNSVEFHNLCASYGITQGTGDWSNCDIAVSGFCVKDTPTEGMYNFVTRLYTTCLERNADAGGVEDWANRLAHGETGSNVAYGFVFSTEYINKNAANNEYVNMLYRTMLGREADADGQAYWTGMLKAGYSREQVFDGFLQSTEFAGFCAEAGIVVGDPIPYAPPQTCEQVGHSFVDTVVSPTCTEYGYTEHECTRCGLITYGDYTGALGHDMHGSITKEATCSSEGIVTYTCSRCDYSDTEQTARNYNNHKYEITIIQPTCSQSGYTEHKCSLCGDTYYDNTVEATGHSKGNVIRVVDASKEAQGYTVYACSGCGIEMKDDYTDFQPTEMQVYNDMVALKTSYPEGMPWTNDNFYSSQAIFYSLQGTPFRMGGYGCHGFALILSDEAFGYLPGRYHTDFSNIRVGDILRINYDAHTVIVLEVKPDSVIVAEGNYNNSIHWGREISLSEIRETGEYVITRYPQ